MVVGATHGWLIPVLLTVVVLAVLILISARPFVRLGDAVRSRRPLSRTGNAGADPDAQFKRPDNESDLL